METGSSVTAAAVVLKLGLCVAENRRLIFDVQGIDGHITFFFFGQKYSRRLKWINSSKVCIVRQVFFCSVCIAYCLKTA